MELNDNNIEEQILLLADGELEAPAVEAVLAYIGQHAEYQAMLDAYLSVQLQPEEDIVFPGKESLLREEPQTMALKPRSMMSGWRWAAAVALLLIVGVAAALLLQRPDYNEGPSVAKQSPVVQKAVPPAVQQGSLIASVNPEKQTKAPQKDRKLVPQRPLNSSRRQSPVVAVVEPQQRKIESIASLATVAGQNLPVATDPVAVQEKKEALVAVVQEPSPSWSPLKEETVQGVNELVAQVRTFREDVRQKTQLLKNATIVLRLGNKEIALNK